MMQNRIARRIGALVAALAVLAPPGGKSQTQAPMFPGGAPTPPARPSSMPTGAPPAPSGESTSAAAPLPAAATDDYTPVTLPQASRARMHECGLEWERMQKSGATANILWRDFARVCLTRAEGEAAVKPGAKK